MTKQGLIDQLRALTAENAYLKRENEAFRNALLDIYVKTRSVLGIEAAIQAREDERTKKQQA